MNIMLSDSHAMFRDGVRPFLSSLNSGALIAEAGTFQETVAIVASRDNIDIAVVANTLPDLDLPALMGLLRKRHPCARAALLTTGECQREAVEAVGLGFSGYIPKRLPMSAFLAALNLIHSGEIFVPAALLAPRAKHPDRAPARPEVDLTPRESEVMELLRQGLPNKAIARTLNISDVTVKCHLGHIFDKLGVKNRVQAARFSFGDD
ncbi:response regulator transcription factor [Azospirillum sp.]|uniref:response regulator transcription factor n=1 Tax=Azospirillum sp. TaxID=34012 RepID=UPI002D6621E1|nr:response regulator transcription factor [Azospirillum sp.]HYD66462.1 response regulator transcription factor [Azospirillum sp.]